MTPRIERLIKRMHEETVFPICTEKIRIFTDVYQKNEGQPLIIRRALAEAAYMDQRTIFFDDDQLLPYNMAAKPLGIETRPTSAAWPDEDLESILSGGIMTLSDEDHKVLRDLDEYWLDKNRSYDEMRKSYLLGDDELFAYVKRGFQTPPWSPVQLLGAAGDGWAGKNPVMLICPDYSMHLKEGFSKFVADAKAALATMSFSDASDTVEKIDYLRATIIAFEGCIRLGRRYAALADELAAKETDPAKAKEYRDMAEICHRVPEFGARTFREALTAYTFYWNLFASGGTGLGRMDMYLYPYYKADIEAGRITRDEALELLACWRLKIMEFNYCMGGKFQREKWAGMARWNNIILGGCDETGKDACNDLTMLLLESALVVKSPHPTMTLRVSDNTPPEVMRKAVELVSTGCGIPAFVSEKYYIDYIHSTGTPLEVARQFAISGCLDATVPGRARVSSVAMFVVPAAIECAMNDGKNPANGEQLGPKTGNLSDFKTYDEFYDAIMKQLDYCARKYRDNTTLKILVDRRLFQDAILSGFFHDSLTECLDINCRKMPYENGVEFNVVGMVNAINSLAAVKKLCYEDKVCTPAEMHDALLKNWEGYEDLRRKCLEVPKYGNDIEYVDDIGAKFWVDIKKVIEKYKTIYGAPMVPTGISISAHAPGGKFLTATPDGRMAGETLADGAASPVQGTDKNGPLAVMKSAMKMGKGWAVVLLNMKFHPSALQNAADFDKLGSMIKVYMENGGSHVQFNVVARETLESAKAKPEEHKDLIVRVAGYSAYFVQLTDRIQNEVIERTAHTL